MVAPQLQVPDRVQMVSVPVGEQHRGGSDSGVPPAHDVHHSELLRITASSNRRLGAHAFYLRV
jgi:hypothetical protein